MADQKQSPLSGAVFGSARQGAKQFQEDAFFYQASATEKVLVFGVLDGHGGYNGLVASNTARNFCQAYFKKLSKVCESWSVAEWRSRLMELFDKAHECIREKFLSDDTAGNEKRYRDDKNIVRHPGGDPIHGGSTCSVAVLIFNDDGSKDIVCANSGDSTGLVFQNGKPNDYQFITVVKHKRGG